MEATTDAAPAQLAGRGKLILIIDDDEATRDLLQRLLVKQGYAVETAENGAAGLQQARLLHPDLILLDVAMPVLDGWQVLSALKAATALANIPVIILTVVEEQALGYALGAADYLIKPIDRARLVAALQQRV